MTQSMKKAILLIILLPLIILALIYALITAPFQRKKEEDLFDERGFLKPPAFLDKTEAQNKTQDKPQPPCPKYISMEVKDFHHPTNNLGTFKVEAKQLLQWLNERGRSGEFESRFKKWLEQADSSNDAPYLLSWDTVYRLNLEFFIDDALEHDRAIKAYCPACEVERTNGDMKLIQESCGGWVYRFVDCQCGNRLANYEVMHFHLVSGAEMPKTLTDVIKDFK